MPRILSPIDPLKRLVYTPREQFLAFHNREQRWGVVCTHRRAGKTVALVNDLILGARTTELRKPIVAYIGPTFTQAKRVAWTYLKDYSQEHWARPPSESELKITLKNDATILCLGADNPDSLRGIYLDAAVMDEYALFRPSVFPLIIRPALSDRNGWGVFASTPRGRNLFFDEYRHAQLNPDEYHLTFLRADTSGIIPHAELLDLQRHMDPEEFAQEYMCSFDSALKGAIYAYEVNKMFEEGRAPTTSPLYDPSLPTNFIYDLGFTDSTVRIAWQVHKSGFLHVVNVEATHGTDIMYHIESLHNFASLGHDGTSAGIGEVWLPPDARAKNLQTGRSIVEQFLANGITPRVVPVHNIRDGISAARKIFPAVKIDLAPVSPDTPDVYVTGELLEALKAYRREWDENTMAFSEKPVHDWASDYADCFRYMAMVALPVLQSQITSSDRYLRDLRESTFRNRIELPGYNLEQLHADAAARRGGDPMRVH